MRRRVLTTLALVALTVTAGCAGLGTTAGSPAYSTNQAASTDARTITVSASGEAAADPNLAVVRVSVVATAANASTARQRVAADANAVRHALRDAGITKDDVRTVRYGIEPEYDRKRETVTGYRAVHTFEVTVQDPDAVGAVIDAAVGAGADRVEEVRFTLTADRRAALRKRALKRAVTNARMDAEAIASAANVRIQRVVSVDATQSGDGFEKAVAFTAAEGGGTELESGPVTVRVRVTVTYRIA